VDFCRAYDIGSFVGRKPTRTWFKSGFVKSLIQTGSAMRGWAMCPPCTS
jgi:hypothetical protein